MTGFEPFGQSSINPSGDIAMDLDGTNLAEFTVIGRILPVEYPLAGEMLVDILSKDDFDAVIMLGLAADRKGISLERVAINLLDFDIKDNSGQQIKDSPITNNGPAAYFSTANIRNILSSLESAGCNANISLSAGAYLCNYIYYLGLSYACTSSRNIPVIFVHIPPINEQSSHFTNDVTTMSFEDIVSAIRLIISSL